VAFGAVFMQKRSFMFDAKQFAAAFCAARDDSRSTRSEPDVIMWQGGGAGSAGTGFAWSHGQLYQGRAHLFRVSSLSIADAGATGVYVSGRVMRLMKISDVSGNYRASSAGATIAGDSLATYVQNERGVVIERVARDVATG
jgi:hypothetical protein